MGFGYLYGVVIMKFWAHGKVLIRATMRGYAYSYLDDPVKLSGNVLVRKLHWD